MRPDVCLVMPTIRSPEAVRAYAENARAHGFDRDRLFVLLVTEDHCDASAMERMLADEGLDGAAFDATRRERWFEARGLAEYASLVPEASHAQTSFGLLYLWDRGFEVGVFVDDDTAPLPEFDFFGRHLRNLSYEGPVEEVSSTTRWANVLYPRADEHGLYPRGYPYGAMGERVHTREAHVDDVVASQGLWTNVPDLDAVRILADGDLRGQAATRLSRADVDHDFAAAPGTYLTVCSMNLAFRREVVPAFYQLPMDDNPWDVGRFDDIWSGVFLKRACDVLGKTVLTGRPLCRHDKAPRSTFADLASEVAGLELNEHLWEVIDDAGADAETYAGVYAAMADRLADGSFDDWTNGGFLNYVGEHMHRWLSCLDELAAEPVPASSD